MLRKYNITINVAFWLLVAAIITGLKEEESEEDVMNIIDAAAGTPDVSLQGPDLEKAKNLAVDEWRREKRTSAS